MGASGQQLLNFGAWPGKAEAQVDVAGQAGFVAASEVEAWVQPAATAEHSADENEIESIRIVARYKVDGTFTIKGYENSPPQIKLNDRKLPARNYLYGNFNIGWAWN